MGTGDSNRVYGPNSIETKEMQVSPGANALRNDFYSDGGKNFAYGTVQAAKDTLLHPSYWSSTALQVGGFGGANAVNNGNGTVTFTIPNVAGVKSFFYHLLSDRSESTGPMRNINQTFTWTENMPGTPVLNYPALDSVTPLYNQFFENPKSLNTSSTRSGSESSSAAGGYVIYPNKPNTNMLRSVYEK